MTYYIEASCGAMIGQLFKNLPDDQIQYHLRTADLVVPNMESWRLKWDFEMLKETYELLPETTLGQRCLHAANAAMTAFKRQKDGTIEVARRKIAEIIGVREEVKQDAASHSGAAWALGHW